MTRQSMKEILMTLGTILAVISIGKIIIVEPIMITKEEEPSNYEVVTGKDHSISEAEDIQILPESVLENYLGSCNKPTNPCELCEYLLRIYMFGNTIRSPLTEEKVKAFLGKICRIVPSSIEGDCKEFLNTYEDPIVSLLVQRIESVLVCPMIRICPPDELLTMWEVIPKQFIATNNKPNCPFCLFAVTQINNVVKNNTTQASIEDELDKFCNRLPQDLTNVCTEFIKVNRKDLVYLLLTGSSVEEVCAYLNVCVPSDRDDSNL